VFNTNSALNKHKIVAAKGRVAPLKSLSIPRMELLAAVLGLALTLAICSSFKMSIRQCKFWSDSMKFCIGFIVITGSIRHLLQIV
jgi:hypothetical protein